MLKLMWQKGDKRGVVGGGEKNLQLLLGLGGILHTWWHLGDGSRKDGQVTQASRYFQLLITNAEEKKKSSSHVFSMWGGASYPYPGIPTKGHCQEDGFKPTNQSKNTPRGTEKGLLRDKQLCTNTKEGVGHFHTKVQHHETNMLPIMTPLSEQPHCHYTALSTHANPRYFKHLIQKLWLPSLRNRKK